MFNIKKGFKIEKVEIAKYKSLSNFHIDFTDNGNILPVIVLIGEHGCGKTTLLDAIKQRASGANLTSVGKRKILHIRDHVNNNAALKGIIRKTIALAIDSNWKNNSNLSAVDIYESVSKKILDSLGLVKLNVKFVGISDLYTEIFEDPYGNTFTYNDLSDGEKNILYRLAYMRLSDFRDGVVLVDGPEKGTHPSVQANMLKVYEDFALENNCQVIIATHSPHIVGSTNNKYLRILSRERTESIVVSNVLAYGRDIEWVLEDVMETPLTRDSCIVNMIEKCYSLLNVEKYDETEECINDLERIIGPNDSSVLSLRNAIAFERLDFEEDSTTPSVSVDEGDPF